MQKSSDAPPRPAALWRSPSGLRTVAAAAPAAAVQQRGTADLAAQPWVAASVLLLIVLLVYRQAVTLLFTGDDFLILHRLRTVGGLQDPLTYFRLPFFEYYRPIAFLSYALDWQLWGERPVAFHLTSLFLHAANTLLVFAIARHFAGALTAAIGAALFAVHASNHEAVFWVSARFDLLATFFLLLAFWCFILPGRWRIATGAAAFMLALLSKESALAFPLLIAAYDVFIGRRSARDLLARMAPLIAVLAVYAIMRAQAGGLEATGGADRLPKIAMLFGSLGILVWRASAGWDRAARRALPWRPQTAGVVVAGLVIATAGALWAEGGFFREKLAFVGFSGYHLASPIVSPPPAPYFLDPNTAVYWLAGLATLAAGAAVLLICWHAVLLDPRVTFLIVFVAASLIPVSSMTEGKRYLYLASIGVSLLLAWIVTTLHGRRRQAGFAAVALLAIVSAWQIGAKAGDWRWAGTMTQDALALVDATIAPACGEGEVVLLTAPVGIHDVYSHLYRESFAQPRGCLPERVRTVIRVVRGDTAVEASWEGDSTIVLRAPRYSGNFVAAADLRHFDAPLRAVRDRDLDTPLGRLEARADGEAQIVRLQLDAAMVPADLHFFYYSAGRLHRLGPAAASH